MSVLANSLSESIEIPTPMDSIARKGKGKVSEKNKVIAACTGAVITSLTMTPFDVIKTRLQTQTPIEPMFHPSSHLPPPSANHPWPPIASTSSALPPSTSSAAGNLATCCQKTYFNSNVENSSLLCKFDPRVSTHSLPSSGSHLISTGSARISAIRPPFLPPSIPSLLHTTSATCLFPSASAASVLLPAQSLASSSRHLTGFWDAVIKITRHEGLSAMWRGTGPALAMSIPGQAVYMLGYDYGRRTAFNNAPEWAYNPVKAGPDGLRPQEKKLRVSYLTVIPLIAGSLSRTLVAVLVSPVELLRTRLQSSTSATTVRTVLQSMKNDPSGWRSAWRGLPPTLWRDVPFSGIYWAGYEGFRRTLTGGKGMGEGWEDSSVWEEVGIAFVSGAGSGMIAATLTNPFDVVKTRRQALDPSTPINPSKLKTKAIQTKTFAIILEIAQKEGRAGLMRGLAPRLAKVGPACGIMIASYEVLSRKILAE